MTIAGVGSRPDTRDVRRLAFLFLGAVLLAAVGMLREVGPHDEGLVLMAGRRVADGQLPYQDFWWNYGPGLAVLQGGLALVDADSILLWRVGRVLVGALVAVLAYLLARREGAGERWALAAWLVAAGAMAWPLTPGPTAYALAAALGALLTEDRRVSGPLAGLAAWLRPELGVVAALGAGRGARVPALLVTALLYAPFVLAAPGDAYDDLVAFPLSQQALQRLPVPFDLSADPNKLLEGTVFAVVLLGAALCLLSKMPLRLVPLLLAAVAYLLARADEFHLVPLTVVVAVVLARRPKLGAAVLVLLALHGLDRQAVRFKDGLVPLQDGVRADPAFVHDVAALRRAIPPGVPLFVAPARFDRVRFGAPLINVLTDHDNPTRHDVIQPGVVTREGVQRDIVEDLRRSRAWVVRWTAPAARVQEPNGAGRERGSRYADRVLAREWRRVAATPRFVVLRPR